MSANTALHIAVLPGDGIGPEVMEPALEVLRKIEKTTDLKFRFTEAAAGAKDSQDGKGGAEALLSKVLGDQELLKSLASAPKPAG